MTRVIPVNIKDEAEFTDDELKLLIDASLHNINVRKAQKMLYERFNAPGYMRGYEIAYHAYKYDKEKYDNCGYFEDIDFDEDIYY